MFLVYIEPNMASQLLDDKSANERSLLPLLLPVVLKISSGYRDPSLDHVSLSAAKIFHEEFHVASQLASSSET